MTQKININSRYFLVSGLPLSFGFAIQFYNPISSIKYTVPYHTDSTLEYERIPFLDTIQGSLLTGMENKTQNIGNFNFFAYILFPVIKIYKVT